MTGQFHRHSDIKERAINNGPLEGRSHASDVKVVNDRKISRGQVLAAITNEQHKEEQKLAAMSSGYFPILLVTSSGRSLPSTGAASGKVTLKSDTLWNTVLNNSNANYQC
ncbi:Inter-Alpha-Trypsin Inhibitor Heavy Chain H6 [Manis pentadactyla]|nr:Inter-Alpha-Trypsin Inhibitor Heavy Chain H6 [Manis pentadactyla]